MTNADELLKLMNLVEQATRHQYPDIVAGARAAIDFLRDQAAKGIQVEVPEPVAVPSDPAIHDPELPLNPIRR